MHCQNHIIEDTFGLDEKELQELGDEEADALLAELAHSQEEVARMIAEQKQGASDLSGLRDSLAAELEALKQEAWKMQMFGERPGFESLPSLVPKNCNPTDRGTRISQASARGNHRPGSRSRRSRGSSGCAH